MTNEEIQKYLEFMMQRQEVFTEHLQRLEENQEKLQAEVRGLAGIVRQLGEAQIQTQNDLSHLTKIVTGLVEIVTRDRNGGRQG